MNLGKTLENLRNKKELTQYELSSLLGCSRSYISEIESNKKLPSIEFLEKYSAIFKIKLSKIFLGAEKIND